MSQVLFAVRWYLLVQAFGFAALPLTLRLFRYLPDHGYGVSKPLGLLLTGWVFWLLTTLGWLHNTAGGIVAALVLVGILGIILYLANRQPDQAMNQSAERPSWRVLLVTEAVFALAFAAWCAVRAHQPRIETAGGEKWMEIAFLRAILRSDAFPPHDPWLSGFAISYYYFGYVIIAMITRLAAVLPSIAFNLGVAMLFALTCTGAFSLVYNLIAAERAKPESGIVKRAILGGLLGPLLVAVMGNLEGLLEVLHARGIGSVSLWRWLDIIQKPPLSFAEGAWVPQRFFWWWQASRVVHDYSPWGDAQDVIDEFPAFSFILGDMHPHVLALPFVLLALALAFNLYRRACLNPGVWNLRLSRWAVSLPLEPWELFAYAICLGGLGFLNTWDFPIYLFVVCAAYVLACLRGSRSASGFTFCVLRFMPLFVVLLVAGIILYLPFWTGFQSQAKGILPNLVNGTRLSQFLVMFGPLLFVAVAFLVDQARRSGVQARAVIKWTLIAALSAAIGAPLMVLGIIAIPLQRGWIPAGGPPMSYVATWLRGEPIPGVGNASGVWALLRNRFLLDSEFLSPSHAVPFWVVTVRSALASPIWTTIGLFALIAVFVLVLKPPTGVQQRIVADHGSDSSIVHDFALLLFAVGALLALSVEYVYIRDQFHVRMNTVFKFYFQTWVLWAIAGAYALTSFIRRGRAAVSTVAVLLIAVGLIYPVLAIPQRAGEQGGPPTLDGAAYLDQAQSADYAAITWLNENVGDASVILEAPGGGYEYAGRVSAHTGLPTILGWSGHEGQWRGSYEEQDRRQPDIETLYTSVNADEVLTLLGKYDISYVYIGPLEQERYPAAGLAKFAALMDAVYDNGTVTIYRRR